MTIESIELKNYRNYEELHMELSQGTNILYGDNAQGKTNILEAVYVCSTTKSHRGSKDKEIIRLRIKPDNFMNRHIVYFILISSMV